MTTHLHVVGAGLAGLSAALTGLHHGARVSIYESAPQAGGRTRSFHDHTLDRTLDNGTHLLLGANGAMLNFIRSVGAERHITPHAARFPILDATDGSLKTITPLSWPMEWTEIIRALWPSTDKTVAQHMDQTASYDSIWAGLAVSILNTPPDLACAALFSRVLRRIFLLGGWGAMRPYSFPHGLSAVIDAAVAHLCRQGATLHVNHRLRHVDGEALHFAHHQIRLTEQDRVVLALPPPADLPTHAIISLHFRLPSAIALPGGQPFLAVGNCPAQWLSLRQDVLSCTLSAAESHLHDDDLPNRLWRHLHPWLPGTVPNTPPVRLVKERRATLSHTPHIQKNRPGAATQWPHVARAGDWIQSPWPCTMESAVLSGRRAARIVLHSV